MIILITIIKEAIASFFDFLKNFYYTINVENRKEIEKMPIELVEALILIAKFCVSYKNCAICSVKNFCGKMPSEW